MRIDLGHDKFIETDDATSDELRLAILTLDAEADSIEAQIFLAKSKFQEEGERTNRDWLVKADYARKRKRKQAQVIRELLADRTRKENIAQSGAPTDFDKAFRQVAREFFRNAGRTDIYDNLIKRTKTLLGETPANQPDPLDRA